jgi:hypothetical protein
MQARSMTAPNDGDHPHRSPGPADHGRTAGTARPHVSSIFDAREIHGCSYRKAARPTHCPLCPDSDQILQSSEMTRWAKIRNQPQRRAGRRAVRLLGRADDSICRLAAPISRTHWVNNSVTRLMDRCRSVAAERGATFHHSQGWSILNLGIPVSDKCTHGSTTRAIVQSISL